MALANLTVARPIPVPAPVMNKPRYLRSIIWVFNHLLVDNVLVDNGAAIYHFALASNNDRANKILENGYGFAIGGPGRSGDGANIGLALPSPNIWRRKVAVWRCSPGARDY